MKKIPKWMFDLMLRSRGTGLYSGFDTRNAQLVEIMSTYDMIQSKERKNFVLAPENLDELFDFYDKIVSDKKIPVQVYICVRRYEPLMRELVEKVGVENIIETLSRYEIGKATEAWVERMLLEIKHVETLARKPARRGGAL